MPGSTSKLPVPPSNECGALPRIVFITGTDTGVGKTLLTGLLLAHKRARGKPAYAMKPFCSGDRADAELLHRLQDGELALNEINPFFFEEPLAPWVAARRLKRRAPVLGEVVDRIRALCNRIAPGSCLLVEGAGGLLVPLGRDYAVLDLIVALRCEALIVSPNKLGTINHTLLSVRALECARREQAGPGQRQTKVVLMQASRPDLSATSNQGILAERLEAVPVISIPFLGPKAASFSAICRYEKKLKKTLARILD